MFRFATLLLAASLAASPALAAKDPCKGVKVKKDAFGSARVFDDGDFKLKKINDTYALYVKFMAGGGYGAFASVTNEQIAAGTSVQILLADGSMVELTTTTDTGPSTSSVMGVVSNWYELPLAVDSAALTTLLAQDWKAARVMKGADAKLTVEYKSNDLAKFRETGTCMLGT